MPRYVFFCEYFLKHFFAVILKNLQKYKSVILFSTNFDKILRLYQAHIIPNPTLCLLFADNDSNNTIPDAAATILAYCPPLLPTKYAQFEVVYTM